MVPVGTLCHEAAHSYIQGGPWIKFIQKWPEQKKGSLPSLAPEVARKVLEEESVFE
jgi:hypothetical protein